MSTLAKKHSYKPPKVGGKMRKTQTIPDQSMSIQTIVERFVKGIPVDVIRRNGVYLDQDDDDLEKVSRMDFDDKHAYAEQMRQRNDAIAEEAKRQQLEREQQAEEAEARRTGIDSLDNTMPNDTSQKPK